MYFTLSTFERSLPIMTSGKKRIIGAITASVVIVLLALPKLLPDRTGDAVKAKQQGQQSGQKVNVGVRIARTKALSENISVPGTVLANEQVELKAEAPGRIVKLALKEGAEVRKGDLLVKINDADLQAQLEKAMASFTLAQDQETRQKTLLNKELISKQDYDLSIKELNASQADIDLYKAQIDKTEIRAPFDGRVGLRYVSEGAYISIGTTIAYFVKMRPLKVEFSVPERYAGKIGPGTKLSFTIQGSLAVHNAIVYAQQPLIDESTRSLRLRALCSGNETGVLPGVFADVQLTIGENPLAIVVPNKAIVPDVKGQKVFLVKEGNAFPQPVITGVRDDEDVEIIKGVAEGDTVVTTGVLMLRPGMAVDIKNIE
jgi:membrane fusion protein, multidrug efflux system